MNFVRSFVKCKVSLADGTVLRSTLLNLLGFNRFESMINRVLSYDQLDCVPRIICEAVVERNNTNSPIYSNVASQLPGVFGGGATGPLQQQQQQQTGGLSPDPFNGLTTGGGGGGSGSQATTSVESPAALTPQGVLSTFLSQIGIGGSSSSSTPQQPISSKFYQNSVAPVQQRPLSAYGYSNQPTTSSGPGYPLNQQQQTPQHINQQALNAALLRQLQQYQYARYPTSRYRFSGQFWLSSQL